mgnify:CR=1 FL=1
MTNSRVESSSGRAARKLRLALMGPAFIAAIGYIDPGNFATNIQAGASFGYKLLWVVVWANLMAMLLQMLSANPRSLSTSGSLVLLGSGGNYRHGHRSRRVYRGGDRL